MISVNRATFTVIGIKMLKEYLKEWVDIDGAAFYLGCALGIFEDDSGDAFRKNKSIFWTNNMLGNSLYDILGTLADIDILEMDEDRLAVRWNTEK